MNIIVSSLFQRLIIIEEPDEVPSGFFLVDSFNQAGHFTSETASSKNCYIFHYILIMSIKRFHCGLSFGRDAVTHKHFLDGDEDHFQVGQERAVVHIPHIHFELVCPADGITAMTL